MQYKLHSGQCDVYLIFKHRIYVSFLESHLCRIRYHMRRTSHLLIAINTASAQLHLLRRAAYVAFVECKLSLIWSLHLLHPGELQVTKTARYLRLQTSRTCYLTSASRSRARAEYARIPPHFRKINPEAGVYFINFFFTAAQKNNPELGVIFCFNIFFCWVKNKLDFFSRTGIFPSNFDTGP